MTTSTASTKTAGSTLGGAFWVAFSAILVGEVLDMLDSLVTTVAGPSILRDLGGSPATLQWLTASYTLALAGGVLVGGRLGDRFGRRRLFLIGMAGFTVTSLIAAFAMSPEMLLASRIAQGALGALMLPQSFGLIRDIMPKERLGQAFGIFGVTLGAASIAGPIVAGFLVNANIFDLGWRAIFAINVPLGIAGLIVGSRALPKSAPDRTLRIDIVGSLLAIFAMISLVFPLVEGRELGWPWWCAAVFALAILLLVVFFLQQRARMRSGSDALLVPSLLAKREFTGGVALSIAFFTAFTSLTFVLAVLLQNGLGLNPLLAAMAMLPQAVGMVAGLKGSEKLLEGRQRLLAGLLVSAFGQALIVTAVVVALASGGALSVWWLAPGLLVTGLGAGAAIGPMFEVIMARLDDRETGSASGVLNTVQQLGGATGVALLGTILFGVAATVAQPLGGLMLGAAWAFGAALILTLVALMIAYRVFPTSRHREATVEVKSAHATD